MDRYAQRERLRNGVEVLVRSVRLDDAPKIRRAFETLDRKTIYTRFFRFRTDVSDEELRRITHVDFKQNVSILVTLGSGDQEVVIGGASYFDLGEKPQKPAAEMAFTVVPDYQGLGIGTLLMRHLIGLARQNGIDQLEADVLASNSGMLEIFKRSGLPMSLHREGTELHVILTVSPDT